MKSWYAAPFTWKVIFMSFWAYNLCRLRPKLNGELPPPNIRNTMTVAIAIIATIIYSVAGTFVIVKLLSLVTNLRAETRDEGMGLDFSQHGEEAYSRGEGAILLLDGRTE